MNSATLSSISAIFGILVPAFMGGLFMWAVLRTRSRHTLFYRMWQLVHGNQEISDTAIRAYVTEQNSLMTFRFIAGVPVKTLESAHQLIQWAKLRDVEMFILRIAGDYFDPDLRRIRTHALPHRITQWAKAILASLSVPLIVVSTSIALANSAIVKVKVTDRWLLMTDKEARPVWPISAEPIYKDTCSSDIKANVEQSKFTAQEVTVLCGVLKNESTPSYIVDAIKKQRLSSLFLIFVTLITGFVFFSEFMSGYVAKQLARRNLDPALSGDQLSLDLSLG